MNKNTTNRSNNKELRIQNIGSTKGGQGQNPAERISVKLNYECIVVIAPAFRLN
jgi:hypothetical protein